MEVPPAMFPSPTRGLAGSSGGGIGDGRDDDGDSLNRTRSNHEQGVSGAFLQDSKSSSRQHFPPGRKHPLPGESGGVGDIISGTHTNSEAHGEIDADSLLPHIPRDAGHGRMPSPAYPVVDVTTFDSGTGIKDDNNDSGDVRASLHVGSSVNERGGEGSFRAEAGDDSFLGFGFDAGHGGGWEQEVSSEGGRDRSSSRQDVEGDFGLPIRSNDGGDSEGTTAISCDLGWGNTDDPSEGWGTGLNWRVDADGEEAGEGEGGGREDREARVPPTFSPVWKRVGHELTRPSRARSSSFYEDDEGVMACINGETPVRKRASSSSGIASDPIDLASYRSGTGFGGSSLSNRHESLAYSSSGEVSASELDASTRPSDSLSGLTASQAAEVMSAGVPRPGRGVGVGAWGSGGGGGGGGGGSPFSAGVGTPASSFGNRDRLLRPNEEKALLEGLRAHAPGRKTSSEASSDSEPEGEVEEDGRYYSGGEGELPPPEGLGFLRGDGYSADYREDGDENLLLPPAGFPDRAFPDGYLRGSIPPRSSATSLSSLSCSPSPPLSHRSNSGDSTESCSILRGASLAGSGEHVFPPGVDPFVSPSLESGLSPPLSPPAGTLSGRGLGSPQPASSSAAVAVSGLGVRRTRSAPAFPLGHLPPPQTSPSRVVAPPSPSSAMDVLACPHGERKSRDAGAEFSWHSPATGEGVNASVAMVKLGGGCAHGAAGGSAEGEGGGDSLGSSMAPATLESLHVSGRSRGGAVRSPATAAPAPPPPPRSPLVRPAPPSPEPIAPSPPPPPPPRLGLGRPATEASSEKVPSGARAIDLPALEIPAPAPEMPAPAALAPKAPGDLAPSSRARGDRSEIGMDSENSAGRSSSSPLMPPPQTMNSMTLQKEQNHASSGLTRGGGSYGSGGGGDGGGTLWRTGSAGPVLGAYGPGGSGSAVGGATGGGGGISRLMGPDGPFGSNRPGYGGLGGYAYAPRATYAPGGGLTGTGGVIGGGGGRSNLYGSDPGTMGGGSARHRGSTGVQGFLSTGGGARQSLRRGYGMSPQAVKIKLLMLGDSGVGKSSLMDRFTEDRFNISTVGTVGVDFKAKAVVINDEDVVVQVWDTAGQQRFHKITRAYYRGSHGIVLVYDVSDPETLDNIAYWMKSIRENAGSNHVQICLVGNKVDLRNEAETGSDGGESDSAFVQTCRGRMIADKFEAEFFECSAKTGFGVTEAYQAVATKAYEAHMAKPPTPSSRSRRRTSRRKQNQTQNLQSLNNPHHRHGGFGSDKDRPPRSDASWSTASSQSGVDSSAERLERLDSSTRLRHSFSDVSEASSTGSTSVASPGSPMAYSGGPSAYPSAHRHSAPFTSTSNAVAGCSSPTTTTTSTTTHSSMGSPSASASSPPGQQQQQPMLLLRSALATLPPGGGNASGVSVSVGMGPTGGKKPGEVVVDDEDSPTGTGTLSPLPGQQRSIGRASSLADVESFFTPPLVGSPQPHPNPSPDSNLKTLSGGEDPEGLGRPRADTASGDFVDRVFGGGEGDAGGVGIDQAGGRTSGIVSEVVGRQQQQQQPPRAQGVTGVSPAAAAAAGEVEAEAGSVLGQDHPPSRTKGRRPPRIPRMKRNESPRAGAGAGRGKSGVCKVS